MGTYRASKREGYGVLTSHDTEQGLTVVYKGEFLNDLRHGYGVETTFSTSNSEKKRERKREGDWREGVWEQDLLNSHNKDAEHEEEKTPIPPKRMNKKRSSANNPRKTSSKKSKRRKRATKGYHDIL